MVGTSFFRSSEGKCPNCGSFGEESEKLELEINKVCPTCDTVFNRFLVLNEGKDIELRNN
jgi:Zn finger protein HypA/HybF involved in hydrogenase expression